MPVPMRLQCGLTNHTEFYQCRVAYTDCAARDDATVEDFRQDVIKDHEHSCECGVQVGKRAWLAGIQLESDDTTGLNPSQFPDLPLNTRLDSEILSDYGAYSRNMEYHIFFEGVRPKVPPVPLFVSRESGDLIEFLPTPGHKFHLPHGSDTSFMRMTVMPGLLLVDKSIFLSPLHSQPVKKRLPLIRRPKGFGKSTFLTELEAFVDADVYPKDFFPRRNGNPAPYTMPNHRGGLLVFHLDLANLAVAPEDSENALRESCRRVLDDAAAKFYHRYYQRLQEEPEEFEVFDDSLHFEYVMDMVHESSYRVFVGIDNYTAPLAKLGHWSALHENVIVEEIFQPLLPFLLHERGSRGLAVGEDIPGAQALPYGCSKCFRYYTVDLTNRYDAFEIMGLTERDITSLGNFVFRGGYNLLHQTRTLADVSPTEIVGEPQSWRVYSTADVMQLVRAQRETPNDPTSFPSHITSVTRDNYPPTADDGIWEPEEEDGMDADDEERTAYDEEMDDDVGLCDEEMEDDATPRHSIDVHEDDEELSTTKVDLTLRDETLPAVPHTPPKKSKAKPRLSDPVSDHGSDTSPEGTVASFGSERPSPPLSASSGPGSPSPHRPTGRR